MNTPKTLGELVKSHVIQDGGFAGTSEGMKFLGVSGSEHNACANTYLASLSIIRKLETQVQELREALTRLLDDESWDAEVNARAILEKTRK